MRFFNRYGSKVLFLFFCRVCLGLWMNKIRIIRPDDWHVHLRDGAVLRAVLPYTAAVFARAIVMPNLRPPVMQTADAVAYKQEIMAALPRGMDFTPLMTLYLTDQTDAEDLAEGFMQGSVTAAKLYPAHATTNSEYGVTDIQALAGVFERMEKIGMPLLVHGEVTDPDVDIFDREAVFIERILQPLRKNFPALKVVFEHLTTKQAVDYVFAEGLNSPLAATITPHHLRINRNDMFKGGLRPHYYCLPVAKREIHRRALVGAATSGAPMFFLGTDTAPHVRTAKESACGCAGIFNANNALQVYAAVFAAENALDKLEAFASLNGPSFYGLPVNNQFLTLEQVELTEQKLSAESVTEVVNLPEGQEIVAFQDSGAAKWRVIPE